MYEAYTCTSSYPHPSLPTRICAFMYMDWWCNWFHLKAKQKIPKYYSSFIKLKF